MRNLKRVFAVIITVAMLASLMVPALASVSYLEEAKKLQQIGLFAGTEADLKLDEDVTRIQGLTFAIRAAGKEEEALAMTDEEVEEQLAKFNDADEIPSWNGNGPKYVAFAIKNGITVGDGQGNFLPLAKISGRAFLVFLLKSGMGYADVTTMTAPDVAVDAGILTPSQAVSYALAEDGIIRDDAAAILYGAASNGVNADGVKFIDALIESGFVKEEDAIAAGFITIVPSELKALNATASNLKEIVVAFDGALDKDAAEKKDNYSVDGKEISKVKLNDDGKSVTIILTAQMNNQDKFKVTVKAGVGIKEDAELSGTAFDVTIPEAVSAVQAGPDSFKVYFSEPVAAPITGNFKVDGGRYFVASVTPGDDGYSATVKLYTTLPTGEHSVEVSGVRDFVPYTCLTKTLTFVAEKDEVAPVVANIDKATPNEVVIVFSEDIQFATSEAHLKDNVYHTNSANKPESASIDGAKLTLKFADANKLPNGTAYLTIGEKVVKDGWNNQNAEVKNLSINVTVDNEKPYVKDAKAETDSKIVITFNENIGTVGSYKILDASGEEVDSEYGIKGDPKLDGDKVTLELKKALPGSTYTVVVEGVKDVAGNEIDKVSVPVPVTDTTRPDVTTTGALYTEKKIAKISFSEVMNADDILNAANYMFGSKYLSEYKVTASVTDGGKAVLLDFSKSEGIDLSGSLEIVVGRVRDAAGNYSQLSTTVTCDPVIDGIAIDKVHATGKKTIVVYLEDTLAKFDVNDFEVSVTTAGVSFENVDGKGVITFTLTEELDTTANGESVVVNVISSEAAIKSENAFGIKLQADSAKNAEDKIAAEIADIEKAATKELKIVFSENVKSTTLSKYTFTVDGNTVTGVKEIGANFIILTLDKDLGDKVTVRQAIDFEDSEGNVSKGLVKEDFKF